MTEEQKKAYIEEHPTSKYSKNYKQADKSSTYKGGISALIEDNKKIDDEIRRLMSYYTMETDNNKKMNFLYKYKDNSSEDIYRINKLLKEKSDEILRKEGPSPKYDALVGLSNKFKKELKYRSERN